MDKDAIFSVIKTHIMDILPDVKEQDIKIEGKMADLGANSLDRADIVVAAMEELNLKIPLVELGKTKNLQGLVDLFYQHLTDNN